MKYFIYTKNIFEILSPKANFFLFIYLLSLLFLTILEALGLGILSLYIGIYNYNHLIEYEQLWGKFENFVSVIDLLMNVGPKSKTHINLNKKYL